MIRLNRPLKFLLLISFNAIFFTGCVQKGPSVHSDTWVIGEIASMTGIEATYGLAAHQGIMLAVDAVNSAGGVRGKKLKWITLDSQGKPDESARAVTRLIFQDHAQVILTGVISSNALAMAPIAQENKIPLIAAIATHPKVTQLGNFIFRICLMDSFQGNVMARFALDHLKLKKIAILRDIKSDYSVGLADTFTTVLKGGGGEIVLEQSYSAGDIDFRSQLTAIRARKPDALYLPGYYTDVSLIARQARELGLDIPLLGGDGWDSPKLKEIGGQALSGSYFSGFYSSASPTVKLKDFIASYQKKYHELPEGLAVMGYEGVQILVDALERAPQSNSIGIREALAANHPVETLTGRISMDQNRNALRSAVVLKIEKSGNLKYEVTVSP